MTMPPDAARTMPPDAARRPGALRSTGAAASAGAAGTGVRRIAAALAALAALHGAPGCGRSAEQHEADALLHAIDALRNAPSEPRAAREALLAELERHPASTPPAVSARDTCARAYRLLLDATAAEARVRALLAAPAGSAGLGALSDLADLAAADAKIKESAATMPRCAEALAELRRAARRGM
ncbi:hypothetical protein WMF18_40490 [Sorangium sp. So ce315]|uniref:hypothetical protein n=1 Tax=Sorangium sp. So ce315 TaxID=3133299 RepID=UPI003F6474E3